MKWLFWLVVMAMMAGGGRGTADGGRRSMRNELGEARATVTVPTPVPPICGVVTAEAMRVYWQAEFEAPLVGYLVQGAEVRVYRQEGEWVHVSGRGVDGAHGVEAGIGGWGRGTEVEVRECSG